MHGILGKCFLIFHAHQFAGKTCGKIISGCSSRILALIFLKNNGNPAQCQALSVNAPPDSINRTFGAHCRNRSAALMQRMVTLYCSLRISACSSATLPAPPGNVKCGCRITICCLEFTVANPIRNISIEAVHYEASALQSSMENYPAHGGGQCQTLLLLLQHIVCHFSSWSASENPLFLHQ